MGLLKLNTNSLEVFILWYHNNLLWFHLRPKAYDDRFKLTILYQTLISFFVSNVLHFVRIYSEYYIMNIFWYSPDFLESNVLHFVRMYSNTLDYIVKHTTNLSLFSTYKTIKVIFYLTIYRSFHSKFWQLQYQWSYINVKFF